MPWSGKLVMFGIIILSLFLPLSIRCNDNAKNAYKNYLLERKKIIDEEQSMSFGFNLILDKKEERVNRILMKYKDEELKTGLIILPKFL
jgi:hypothetical protein